MSKGDKRAKLNSSALLEQLEKCGIKTTMKTVQRYENNGLILQAVRRSGPGIFGKEVKYSPETVYQFCASYFLVHGVFWKVKIDQVPAIRKVALEILSTHWTHDDFINYIVMNENKLEPVWRWILQWKKAQDKRIHEKLGLYCELSDGEPICINLVPIKDKKMSGMLVRMHLI